MLTTRARQIGTAALMLAALSALAGCFRVDINMAVQRDDTVSGTVVMAVDQSVLGMTGSTIDDVLPDDTFQHATVEPYTEGTLVGKKYTIKAMTLAEFSKNEMKLTHQGNQFQFDGTLTFSSDATPQATPASDTMPVTGTINVTMGFPDTITESNGTIDPKTNTVTWTAKDTSTPLVLHAVAGDGSALPSPGTLPRGVWIGGGAGLIALVVVLVIRSAVRRRRAAAWVSWPTPAAETIPRWDGDRPPSGN